jgi:hypothetical protein
MLRVQEVHVEECSGAARPVHGHALHPHLLLHEEQSFLIECRGRWDIRFEANISQYEANFYSLLRQNEANIKKNQI